MLILPAPFFCLTGQHAMTAGMSPDVPALFAPVAHIR